MNKMTIIDEQNIQSKIYTFRGVQVMVDRDLAKLYGVETRRLNEQVKRNKERFPEEFMFQLTKDEFENWMSQFATSNKELMGLRKSPNAFTEQGIFYNGQIFDAYIFVNDIIKSAKKSIILIDNYIDESTLTILSKRDRNCKTTIYTKNITKQTQLDIKKHNAQYPHIEIKKFDLSHDRFLIIDDNEVYHVGASLKDLGKKWFAFSKMDIESFELIRRLK